MSLVVDNTEHPGVPAWIKFKGQGKCAVCGMTANNELLCQVCSFGVLTLSNAVRSAISTADLTFGDPGVLVEYGARLGFLLQQPTEFWEMLEFLSAASMNDVARSQLTRIIEDLGG